MSARELELAPVWVLAWGLVLEWGLVSELESGWVLALGPVWARVLGPA